MRLKMKQYKEKLTKSTLVKIFDDFFDSSEQHFAFKFYVKVGATDEELTSRVIEDFYGCLIGLGYNIGDIEVTDFNEGMREISTHILKLKKEWKVKEKLSEINKDFE